MLRNRKKLPWKLGGGQSQGCPVNKKSIYYKKDSYLHVIVQINSRAAKPWDAKHWNKLPQHLSFGLLLTTTFTANLPIMFNWRTASFLAGISLKFNIQSDVTWENCKLYTFIVLHCSLINTLKWWNWTNRRLWLRKSFLSFSKS